MEKAWLTGLGLAALLAAAWLVQGCDRMNCTEMGCSDSVGVDFEPPLEREGDYQFDVILDGGETITCMTSIPAPKNQICIRPSDSALTFHVAREPESDGITGLGFMGAPRSFELVIRKDGEQISRTTHRPNYSTFYPNGEACDAAWGGCQQASVQVDL